MLNRVAQITTAAQGDLYSCNFRPTNEPSSYTKKLGQCNLHCGSKSFVQKSEREYGHFQEPAEPHSPWDTCLVFALTNTRTHTHADGHD